MFIYHSKLGTIRNQPYWINTDMATISLDYDNTYTADPELWLEFVKNAKSRGHEVVCITMRYPEDNTLDSRLTDLVRVVFTSHEQKRAFCARQNLYPNIWIDDMPEYIVRLEMSDFS
jgi:hypothetical protein